MDQRLKKLQAFINFYFSPWGAAKGELWEWLTRDQPFDSSVAGRICQQIMLGSDDLNWNALKVGE